VKRNDFRKAGNPMVAENSSPKRGSGQSIATKRLVWIVVTLVVITVLFLLYFHQLHEFAEAKSRDTLIVETAKALLQIAGIAALGGWLKFLYDQAMEQQRQAAKTRDDERTSQVAANEIRKGLLNDLIAARSCVEGVRIKYRIEESLDPLEQYRTAILAILEARLNLSRIWNAIETSKYLFPKSHYINDNIYRMKVYLDELINEYENQIVALRKLPEDERISHLRELKVFGDFVLDAEKSHYGARFLVNAYRPAVKEVRKEVLLARQVNVEEE
jgi:hypothetical protein